MSGHSFPFVDDQPVVRLALLPPDRSLSPPPVSVETLLVDTGFSDHVQLDWGTFVSLGLLQYVEGTVTSHLGDGSSVTDILASVRIQVPECGLDTIVHCISNPAYGKDLLLVGGQFLRLCWAMIDYGRQLTTIFRCAS